MQNPAMRRSLFQFTGDIQIRENLVIGINVGLAVGRKDNWADIPQPSGIARSQVVKELPPAGADFDLINLGRNTIVVRYKQILAVSAPADGLFFRPNAGKRSGLAAVYRVKPEFPLPINCHQQFAVRGYAVSYHAFRSDGQRFLTVHILDPIPRGMSR